MTIFADPYCPDLTPEQWERMDREREERLVRAIQEGLKRRKRVTIYRWEGRVRYDLDDACQEYRCDRTALRQAAKLGCRLRGYHWCWPRDLSTFAHRPERNKRPVRRDDGLLYVSAAEAARAMGVVPSAIKDAIRRMHRCAGHAWAYEKETR